MDMIVERGTNETMSGKVRGRNRYISEPLESSMRLWKMMLHPYSKNRFYIPCTFELRTYDAMLTTSIQHIEEDDIEVMRDKMTSMRSIWHMAEHKRIDTRHNGIIGSNIRLAHVAHPHPCLQDGKN